MSSESSSPTATMARKPNPTTAAADPVDGASSGTRVAGIARALGSGLSATALVAAAITTLVAVVDGVSGALTTSTVLTGVA